MTVAVKKINGIAVVNIKKINGLYFGTKELVNTSLAPVTTSKSYYKLENVNDSGPNGYTLTNNGTVTFSAGKFNNGADFGTANSSKYLTNTDLQGLGAESTRTLMCWAKNLAAPGNNVAWLLATFSHATEKRGYYLGYQNAGGTYSVFGGGYKDYAADYKVTSVITLDTSLWHHFGVSFASGTAKFYFDGKYINSVSIPTGNGSGGNTITNGISLGRLGNSGAYQYASMMMDDAALYNSELTAAQFTEIYGNQIKKYMGVSNV